MAIWTVSLHVDVLCGACGDPIPADSPICLMRPRGLTLTSQMPRCEECAAGLGAEVDHFAIEAARARLRAEKPRASKPATSSPERSFRQLGAFDSKMAAAGDRE